MFLYFTTSACYWKFKVKKHNSLSMHIVHTTASKG